MFFIIIILIILFFFIRFKITFKFENDNNIISLKIFNIKVKLFKLILKQIKNKKFKLKYNDSICLIKYILRKKIIKKLEINFEINVKNYLKYVYLINFIYIILEVIKNFDIANEYNIGFKKFNKVYLKGIFSINLVNIIYIIIYYNLKKERVIKNDGTSDRRINEKCNDFVGKYD